MTAPVDASAAASDASAGRACRAIHQFLPTWEPGAIGTHALEIHHLLRDRGLASEVFTYESRPGPPDIARHYRDYGRSVAADESDLLIYHAAIGSEIADFLRPRRERLVVDHHNITPCEIFEPWDPVVGENLDWGRQQLAGLARRSVLGLADSAYNEAELREAGYRATAVVPIITDLARRVGDVDEDALARLGRGPGTTWLFVGRLAPNKAQHELVKAFAAYRRVYDPAARLVIVGAVDSTRYATAVQRFVGALGLGDAVELTGAVPAGVLAAHYRSADVFVCLSAHEGLCLPLLEAMYHGLPVVALAAAAVPETAGDAALLVDRATPALVAAAVRRVLTDPALRDFLVAAGHRRVEDFAPQHMRARLLAALEPLLEAG